MKESWRRQNCQYLANSVVRSDPSTVEVVLPFLTSRIDHELFETPSFQQYFPELRRQWKRAGSTSDRYLAGIGGRLEDSGMAQMILTIRRVKIHRLIPLQYHNTFRVQPGLGG